MSINYCTVYGTLQRFDGSKISNEKIIIKKVSVSAALISNQHTIYKTDTDGKFSFNLPQESVAWIYANISGLNKYKDGTPVSIPKSLTADFSTIINSIADFPELIPIINPLVNSDNFVTTADYISHTGDSTIHFVKESILLNNLSGVNISSALNNEVLLYNGSNWINSNLETSSASGIIGQISVFDSSSSLTGYSSLTFNNGSLTSNIINGTTSIITDGYVNSPKYISTPKNITSTIIDCNDSTYFYETITANTTANIINLSNGQTVSIVATNEYNNEFVLSGVAWSYGVVNELTASGTDVYTIMNVNSKLYGIVNKDMR